MLKHDDVDITVLLSWPNAIVDPEFCLMQSDHSILRCETYHRSNYKLLSYMAKLCCRVSSMPKSL